MAAAALAAFNGGDVKRMLSLELFKAPGSGDLEAQGMPLKGGWKPTRKQLGVEDFKALQEVNDKVGAAGELIAVKEERQRLRVDCGCDEPDKYVKHVALNDVGLGYDIESVYPGTKRYIEVKSSVIDPYEFFISKGEIDTLKEKAEQGWIYFVVVDKDLSGGKLVAMINNPFGIECQSSIELTPVKWKAKILPTAKGY